MRVSALLVWVAVAFQPLLAEAAEPPRCLLLYSYHVGYAWNDAVDRGASEVLGEQCEIRRFYMDSKRNPAPRAIRAKAEEVMGVVMEWEPDIIIAADDNASKYVVAPYLKGSRTPVVFCGVNWSVEGYGYPYINATGMVEVAPIDALLEQTEAAMSASLQGRPFRKIRTHFIDADRLSARKIYAWFKKAFDQRGMELIPHFVHTFEEWKLAYREAQQDDLVLLINHAGIEGWDRQQAEVFVAAEGKVFSASNHDWMKSLVALTVAKVPQEQGEWAATTVLKILNGTPISEIPIETNRRTVRFAHPRLLDGLGVTLPLSVSEGAASVH